MAETRSFREILEGKLGNFSPKIETSYIKNYVPGRYDIPIFDLNSVEISQNPNANPYANTQFKAKEPLVSEPFIEPVDVLIENFVLVSELTALGTVAHRTLSSFAEQGLGNSISLSSLKAIKRKLSKRLHPDMGGQCDDFHSMLEAVKVLETELAEKTTD